MLFYVASYLLLYAVTSQASLVLSGTRLIFDGKQREATLTITNQADQPYMVQVWVNTDADDTTSATPFIATPPLFHLAAKQEQLVRVVPVPGDLASDRESLFYFNAQEIPLANQGQQDLLKVALRTRIKLFYRPAGLKGELLAVLPQLQWQLSRNKGKRVLQVTNPTPFHFSFIGIKLASEAASTEITDPALVALLSSQSYLLDHFPLSGRVQVIFSVINDYGGYTAPMSVKVAIMQ